MDIFDRIDRLVTEKGITGAELSREIGLSSGVYSQWKSRAAKPSNKTITKVAAYFNVPPEYIRFGDASDRPAPYTNFSGVTVIPADPIKAAEYEAERTRMRDENRENMQQAPNAMAQQKEPPAEAEGENDLSVQLDAMINMLKNEDGIMFDGMDYSPEAITLLYQSVMTIKETARMLAERDKRESNENRKSGKED